MTSYSQRFKIHPGGFLRASHPNKTNISVQISKRVNAAFTRNDQKQAVAVNRLSDGTQYIYIFFIN